jgi:hypothetical protein
LNRSVFVGIFWLEVVPLRIRHAGFSMTKKQIIALKHNIHATCLTRDLQTNLSFYIAGKRFVGIMSQHVKTKKTKNANMEVKNDGSHMIQKKIMKIMKIKMRRRSTKMEWMKI